jgi:tRNA(Ile)-lysidine synthase
MRAHRRPDLIDRVRHTIDRYALAQPDTRVVAAVSGGADSVALVYLLRALHDRRVLDLVGIAHFNHQLRPAAAADERFCEETAAALGLAFLAGREDVGALARRSRQSIEHAARTARHAFFERARQHFRGDVVALGHTTDDQAETFLLRLIRGAGARGLAAMHPRAGAVIRPLLDCRRLDLRAWLDARGLGFVHDESNEDVSVPRNRVRAELVPLLERRFNPGIVGVLAGAADLAREEWRWMEALVDEQWPDVCRREGTRWLLDAESLAGAPTALVRMVVRRVMVEAARREVRLRDVDRVVGLIRNGGAAFDAPGHRVERLGSQVVLTGRPRGVRGRPPVAGASVNFFSYRLSIPGEVALPEAGWILTAEDAATGGGAHAGSGSGTTAVVRRDRCQALAVRNRRPGDRFRPVGLGGAKKLQDFFVDRKVARDLRDRVPIVVDGSDRIVWVAGHAIDEEFRVSDASQAVIILSLRPLLGGPA